MMVDAAAHAHTYAMICWYGHGFFDVILPPRKQKKVDEEKGADGRTDGRLLPE